MLKFLSFILELLFKVLFTIVDFLVWEVFSNGNWKTKQRQFNSSVYWMERASGAERRSRDQNYKSRREMEEANKKFREELKRKEREISYLRSKI